MGPVRTKAERKWRRSSNHAGSRYNPAVMRSLRPFILTALLCLVAVEASPPVQGAATGAVVAMLQSELQRNFQVLKKEPVPAYLIGYTVHDQRSTYIAASNGALSLCASQNR